MFTFKKIALLGIAGLTAFTMSCSDPSEDGSGEFKNLVLDRDSEGSVYVKTGTVVANDGVTVTKVEAKSNGKALEGLTGLDYGAEVDLAGVTLGGICIANNSTKNDDFKIVFIATFSDNTTTEVTKTQKVNCSTSAPGEDPALVKGSVTLSFSEKSYADIDGTPTPYGQTDAAKLDNLKKIDLVAYSSNDAPDYIYTVSGAIAEGIVTAAIKTAYEGASGTWKNVFIAEIPSEYVSVVKNASKLSDVAAFLAIAGDLFEDGDIESPISAGAGYLVTTTEGALVAVIIGTNGAATVTLNTVGVP